MSGRKERSQDIATISKAEITLPNGTERNPKMTLMISQGIKKALMSGS